MTLTAEQRQERTTYLGASDAAAVLGMSRWSSPLQVWAEKTGLVVPEDISDRLPVKMGNKLEQVVAELFMEETGKNVHRVNETVFHPKYPFIAANLDRRVVGEKAVLEIKTASGWKAKEWEGEEIPPEYILQVMHQLAVSGAEVGYIAVLIGGNQDFKWKEIRRDEKALADMVRREVEFWEKFVVPKVPPAVTSKDKDTLTALYPEGTVGEVLALDSGAAATCEVLEGMEEDLAALKRQIEAQENELRMKLGSSELGTVGPWRVSWKNVPSKRLDMDRVKKEIPEIIAPFYKETKTRRFTIRREDSNGKAG